MTAFVESCVGTAASSAVAADRKARNRPRFRKLLALLRDKRNILITTHLFPDPDALASGWALCQLLADKLPHATVNMSIKGQLGGGINDAFVRLTNLKLTPWDDARLPDYDALILTDVQPGTAVTPFPTDFTPLAVIDHHGGHRSRRPPFRDVRPDVGATTSIVFSYYMESEHPIAPDLAASMLYAIESDLAGVSGQPGDLDNIAMSNLTLLANTRKLYQMRYVDLPQSYYIAYHSALANAMYYDDAVVSHLDVVDSPEQPAVMADFLVRFEPVQWAMVTGLHDGRLAVSLRTHQPRISATDVIHRVLRGIGQGGGHSTKAGGFANLASDSATEIDRTRSLLRRRFLRALGIRQAQGKRLVPKAE